MSLVTQRILSIGKKNYFSKHVNGLITNFSTIRPHSSLPSSPPNQFIINGIGRSEKIIDGELQKKKMIDFIIKSTLSLSVLAVYHILLERKYISSIDFTFCLALSFHSASIYNY
jgi:hypothetical protein